jgi:hypothetical protein
MQSRYNEKVILVDLVSLWTCCFIKIVYVFISSCFEWSQQSITTVLTSLKFVELFLRYVQMGANCAMVAGYTFVVIQSFRGLRCRHKTVMRISFFLIGLFAITAVVLFFLTESFEITPTYVVALFRTEASFINVTTTVTMLLFQAIGFVSVTLCRQLLRKLDNATTSSKDKNVSQGYYLLIISFTVFNAPYCIHNLAIIGVKFPKGLQYTLGWKSLQLAMDSIVVQRQVHSQSEKLVS